MPPFLLSRSFRALLVAVCLLAQVRAAAQTAPPMPQVIQRITDVVGLQPRFELRVTRDVENAAAVVYGGKRYLLYNPDFVAAVNRAGRTDWAGLSILAHEMGHHLNGHTLRPGGSQPPDELEADEFSGFVLRKLGASLAEAQAGLAAVADERGTRTHPGRTPRLAAIGQGWQRADGQIAATRRAPAPSAAPVALADEPVQSTEEEAAAGEPADTAPAVAALRRPARTEQVVGRLTFRDKPSQRYYLTSALKVVHVAADRSAEEVGRLTRTSSRSFPYVLTDNRQKHLFVAPNGNVFDKEGDCVAVLQ